MPADDGLAEPFPLLQQVQQQAPQPLRKPQFQLGRVLTTLREQRQQGDRQERRRELQREALEAQEASSQTQEIPGLPGLRKPSASQLQLGMDQVDVLSPDLLPSPPSATVACPTPVTNACPTPFAEDCLGADGLNEVPGSLTGIRCSSFGLFSRATTRL